MTNDKDAQDALAAIDIKPVEALKTLKQEQDVLAERLTQLEARKSEVADAVYLRVRADYESRNQALEDQSAPLKTEAREQFAALRALLERFTAEHEAVTLDRQEIELRHQLGEFSKKDFEIRIKDLEALLNSRTEASNRAKALKARFLEAFHSEAELEVPAPGLPQSVAQAVAAHVNTQELLPPVVPPVADSRPPSETQMMPALNIPIPPRAAPAPAAAPPAMESPVIGSTVVMRAARLVPQNPEAGKSSVLLGLKSVVIGADSSNDLRVGGPGVDPKHAQISVSMAGYTVVDLGSPHGTRVNAEKVRERLLRDQDVVQVGAARWVFREG